ncbi:MAG: hypothetical protein KGJ41_02700 [Rhodospirillales bacterium]|nr:hypothetical protein [Rhodospirillales bacterium]
MSGSLSTHVWRPGCARRVVIDGFVPVPRGSVPLPYSPPSWPAKDPSDVLDYELDLSAALAGNAGDAIGSVAVAVTPNATGDLVVNSVAMDGAVAVLWCAAGQAGTVYAVRVTAVTLAGRTIGRVVMLPVESLTVAAPPATALTTAQGAIITDQNGNPILLGG